MSDFIPYAELTEGQRAQVDDPDPTERAWAAMQGLGADKLARDEDWMVRQAVAANGDFLDALTDDPDVSVRVAVAQQGHAWCELSRDPDWRVRHAVAERGLALDLLIHDDDMYVSNEAFDALAKAGYQETETGVVRWVAENPDAAAFMPADHEQLLDGYLWEDGTSLEEIGEEGRRGIYRSLAEQLVPAAAAHADDPEWDGNEDVIADTVRSWARERGLAAGIEPELTPGQQLVGAAAAMGYGVYNVATGRTYILDIDYSEGVYKGLLTADTPLPYLRRNDGTHESAQDYSLANYPAPESDEPGAMGRISPDEPVTLGPQWWLEERTTQNLAVEVDRDPSAWSTADGESIDNALELRRLAQEGTDLDTPQAPAQAMRQAGSVEALEVFEGPESSTALLLDREADRSARYVVAYGYDPETGSWESDYRTSNLARAIDLADPEVLEDATVRWMREDLAAALEEEGIAPTDYNVSALAGLTGGMRGWRDYAIENGNEEIASEVRYMPDRLDVELTRATVELDNDRTAEVLIASAGEFESEPGEQVYHLGMTRRQLLEAQRDLVDLEGPDGDFALLEIGESTIASVEKGVLDREPQRKTQNRDERETDTMTSKLQQARREAGYRTAADFAEEIGAPASDWARWEDIGRDGEPAARFDMPLDVAQRASEALGMPVTEVTGIPNNRLMYSRELNKDVRVPFWDTYEPHPIGRSRGTIVTAAAIKADKPIYNVSTGKAYRLLTAYSDTVSSTGEVFVGVGSTTVSLDSIKRADGSIDDNLLHAAEYTPVEARVPVAMEPGWYRTTPEILDISAEINANPREWCLGVAESIERFTGVIDSENQHSAQQQERSDAGRRVVLDPLGSDYRAVLHDPDAGLYVEVEYTADPEDAGADYDFKVFDDVTGHLIVESQGGLPDEPGSLHRVMEIRDDVNYELAGLWPTALHDDAQIMPEGEERDALLGRMDEWADRDFDRSLEVPSVGQWRGDAALEAAERHGVEGWQPTSLMGAGGFTPEQKAGDISTAADREPLEQEAAPKPEVYAYNPEEQSVVGVWDSDSNAPGWYWERYTLADDGTWESTDGGLWDYKLDEATGEITEGYKSAREAYEDAVRHDGDVPCDVGYFEMAFESSQRAQTHRYGQRDDNAKAMADEKGDGMKIYRDGVAIELTETELAKAANTWQAQNDLAYVKENIGAKLEDLSFDDSVLNAAQREALATAVAAEWREDMEGLEEPPSSSEEWGMLGDAVEKVAARPSVYMSPSVAVQAGKEPAADYNKVTKQGFVILDSHQSYGKYSDVLCFKQTKYGPEFAIGHGYDAETGEWSQGLYCNDLPTAEWDHLCGRDVPWWRDKVADECDMEGLPKDAIVVALPDGYAVAQCDDATGIAMELYDKSGNFASDLAYFSQKPDFEKGEMGDYVLHVANLKEPAGANLHEVVRVSGEDLGHIGEGAIDDMLHKEIAEEMDKGPSIKSAFDKAAALSEKTPSAHNERKKGDDPR